jgi:hypothetical protein
MGRFFPMPVSNPRQSKGFWLEIQKLDVGKN